MARGSMANLVSGKLLMTSGLLFLLFLAACSQSPQPALLTQTSNPNASLAFFGINNLSNKMRLEYADAMQKEGIFNFTTEEPSEEQLKNAVEIRIAYTEKKAEYNRIPVLRINVEIYEHGELKFSFRIIEESIKTTVDRRELIREKKYKETVLLKRFLEELKRLKAEAENEANA